MSVILKKELPLEWEVNPDGEILFAFRVETECVEQPSQFDPCIECPSLTPTPKVYFGLDPGAGPGDARPRADAASKQWRDKVFNMGDLEEINLEGQTPTICPVTDQTIGDGVQVSIVNGSCTFDAGITDDTLSWDSTGTSNPGPNTPVIIGYNTTPGGSNFIRVVPQFGMTFVDLIFSFERPIQAFGTYITGLGTASGDLHVQYNVGEDQDQALTGHSDGGVSFFGFTSPGAQIFEVKFHLDVDPNLPGDIISYDDISYAPNNDPNSVACGNCEVEMFGKKSTGQSLIFTVIATDVNDVCRQLGDRNFDFRIKRVDRWTNPVRRSDRAKIEASSGITFGKNCLRNVPFRQFSECNKFIIDYDTRVTIDADVMAELDPASLIFDPPFTFIGGDTGGGIVIGGLDVDLTLGAGVGIIGVPIEIDGDDFPVLLPAPVKVACDCAPLAQLLRVHHTLVRDNPLDDFLKINALKLPREILIRYNGNRVHWSETNLFTGENGNGQKEQWRLVWSWGCRDVVGGFETTGSASWQFGLSVSRNNLTLNRGSGTRIFIVFRPEGICATESTFDFKIEINTDALVANLPRNPNTLVQHFALSDGIGLFSSDAWKRNNPIFTVELTQLERLSGTGKKDIEPIFPRPDRVLLRQTDTGVSVVSS